MKKKQNDHDWVDEEFTSNSFGDIRIGKRMIKLAKTLSKQPSASINNACADWAEMKAAYRFFDNDKVTSEKIISEHFLHKGSFWHVKLHQ
ncbi:MAG: transposase [Oligoflexia bacterium]|nr:transposase [Oligoflexia bacterium]MBF0366327.1 transposase [Oligoflexia bacterium]